MGKIIKFVLYLTVLSSINPLCAAKAGDNPEFTFIGVGAKTLTLQFDDNLSRPDTDINTFSLHLGKQTRKARTVFELDYTSDFVSTSIWVDYIPFDTMFGTPKLRPYIGINAQYLRYEDDDTDEDGFGLGARTGLLLYATESVDIDLNYNYTFIQNSDILDSNYGFSVSLHYFFE
jgi:opacity protein-like surface antigen